MSALSQQSEISDALTVFSILNQLAGEADLSVDSLLPILELVYDFSLRENYESLQKKILERLLELPYDTNYKTRSFDLQT